MPFAKPSASAMTPNELHDDSTRTSIESNDLKHTNTSPMSPPPPSISPSIHLLFSFIPRKHLLCLVLPAILSSIITGGIAPFMTYVVGQAFDAFAHFPLSPNPPRQAKDDLLHGIGVAALELIGLTVGSLALSSITSCLWIWTGETNVMALRKAIYSAVAQKDMTWFDMHMGATDTPTTDDGQGPLGAGGLMAKFSKETDDVRTASSLASGLLLQHLMTCLTCLLLAFLRSWALTLVILSAVPLLLLIQALTQAHAAPLLATERTQAGVAATFIERAVAGIATVKAFNAPAHEHARATALFLGLQTTARKLNALWAGTAGAAQFATMAMFVQGFWFGGKLVREGRATAGDVMAVFWACLIATSNLQMCVPQLVVLAKGKWAAAALLELVGDAQPGFEPRGECSEPVQRLSPRKLNPSRCSGSLALQNVSFAYPSRPSLTVLSNVSLFLPAHETTYIVGASGSGKSTVAHLLLKMYEPTKGTITLDERDMRTLDDAWVRENVACVRQGGAVIFEGRSVFDNVALAALAAGGQGQRREPKRKEVEEACRAALMHEFVRDLPEGYDTRLGSATGVGLSGGQKQRLEIARARVRDPTVLILDEPTSALDPTSRILVFEALKRWRKHKTTIVITHDLSQIGSGDFLYVMKDGRVVEQGYRADLEGVVPMKYGRDNTDKVRDGGKGEFRKMLEAQRMQEKGSLDEIYLQEERMERMEVIPSPSSLLGRQRSTVLRPLTFGSWMFDVVADLTSHAANQNRLRVQSRNSYNPPVDNYTWAPDRHRRPSTLYIPESMSHSRFVPPKGPSAVVTVHAKRYSLPASGLLTPTSATLTDGTSCEERLAGTILDDGDRGFLTKEKEKSALERSAFRARQVRSARAPGRTRRGDADVLSYVKVEKSSLREGGDWVSSSANGLPDTEERLPSFWALLTSVYPSIPRKPLLFVGVAVCVLSGAMTPLFSFLLSRLLFEVSVGAQDVSAINKFGAIVLSIAALDGLLLGLKYFLMETCAMAWVTSLRTLALHRVLAQDKKWFDKPVNGPARLVQMLVKDADDARDLVAVVLAQGCVVCAMLGVGLVWAFVRGWQLTLAGLAIAPVFAGIMAVQSRLVARCEVRNKRAREEVARGYYETIINIRAIRCMAFDGVFKAQFEEAVEKSLTTGVRGAFVEGCTYGVASGLIYLAEALLFYVGALLIAHGLYTYLQMVEVLNLVVFSVTIGSQLMAFTEKIAKSVQATSDFDKLMKLDMDTYESRGSLRPEIAGAIRFTKVNFSYPERRDVPVLRDMDLRIAQGECVAIVGSSGCGKSTIASLLQRLYEPTSGSVTIGGIDTRLIDVHHLREHVAVVSQQPHLFDASVAENIRYGHPSISDADVRCAARAANIHEFVMSLPEGYDTTLGENASLVSGGQAQRLQIARALARPSRILILDECTSSLDPENQAAVLETIRGAKCGRTTVVITHKLEAMLMCDRIVVVHEGEVVEEGSYERLMERKGVFATLARGGEWVGE
ncbi:P-loop containing nucleoside triphosphate hydrolase protein [Flammula alnicola]|nr:P-loop containing nucleoside triphosphate hydrolase protein [Flammula alnicola]